MSIHILLVEDDEFLVEALQVFLEDYNYKVSVATNGGDALATAQSVVFDVAVSDINMPGMDGFELCESLRQRHRLPVVLMTGYGIEDMELRSCQVGAHAVLRKPFLPDVLHQAIIGVTRAGMAAG
jgi:CheY-like chemotaxis protein